jgi:hypothetical protein
MARIHQDVNDISSVDQLLSYAAVGQMEPLLEDGYTQERLAMGAGLGTTTRIAGPVLATALKNGGLTLKQLRGLDEIIGALTTDLDRTGGLCSLALRLSGSRDGRQGRLRENSLAAQVPSSWTRQILADPPASEIAMLFQASALASEFAAAGRTKLPSAVASIRKTYGSELDVLAQRLILISVGPPTSRNYDAQTLLGMLASYSFDKMKDLLESKLRYAPMGFRVWRSVTKLVRLSEDGGRAEEIREWVRTLVRDSGRLRADSLYAGSCYDLELALTVPVAWSPPADDWVGRALWDRVRDSRATIRERGTAAMGLWQRAITDDRSDLGDTEKGLRELITEFRDPATRPDAAAGLRWLAAVLESVIDERTGVCNSWPEMNEPWYQHVKVAAAEISKPNVPEHLVEGTRNLFRHMILQNSSVYRRYAVETVVTSGMNRPVGRALVSLLEAETEEAWLRVRALSALGFMQRNSVTAQNDLTNACMAAYRHLNKAPDENGPTRSQITEMHASLFAVGDCFGSAETEKRGKNARELLRPVLTGLAEAEGGRAEMMTRPARAVAYLLAMTAQPEADGRKDMSAELLEKLASHPDQVTRRLSQWVLSFRFAPDGAIRPLVRAVEEGAPDDTPY